MQREWPQKLQKLCILNGVFLFAGATNSISLGIFCGKVQVRSKQSFNILLRGVQCIVTYFFDIK